MDRQPKGFSNSNSTSAHIVHYHNGMKSHSHEQKHIYSIIFSQIGVMGVFHNENM